MAHAVGALAPDADVLVMAAAPSDFRPATVASQKIKKGTDAPVLQMEQTVDILRSTVGKRRKGSVIVGFALETTDAIANARTKLAGKSLDLIVVNDATEAGAGFGGDTNRVTFLGRDGSAEELPLMSKADVADALLDRVERIASGR
jgi:phosphopantothenoylcysteine decarboxylase/phosphopantothenate--cysteine ligase